MPVSEPTRQEQRFPARRARAIAAAGDRTPETVVYPDGGLDLVTRDLSRRLRAETALIARRDGSERSAEILSSWGAHADRDRLALPEGGGFVGRVLSCEHAAAGPLDRDDRGLGIPVSGARLTHALGAPLPVPGQAAALCAGFSGPPPGVRDANVSLIESYARLAALCLHDPVALDGLLEAVRHDGLTGCLNYTSMRDELLREIGRAARHKLSLSCCFIDLDGFKKVNTRHGHVLGNKVLAEAALLLAGAVRGCDTVGRYGGDEFVVILPETGEAEARTLAARLRAKVAEARFPVAGDRLDASVGVAEWHIGDSADDVLEAADRAQRAAKAAGGGTVVAAREADERLSSRVQAARG